MTIPPPYTITNKIVSLLTKIETNKITNNSHKIPEKIVNNLTHLSLLKNSVYSAQIVGNTLTPEDIENKTQQKERQYEREEIENIILALTILQEKQIPEVIDIPIYSGFTGLLRTNLSTHLR